jgi:hypothetical protein
VAECPTPTVSGCGWDVDSGCFISSPIVFFFMLTHGPLEWSEAWDGQNGGHCPGNTVISAQTGVGLIPDLWAGSLLHSGLRTQNA